MYCQKCGQLLQEGIKFCGKCGASVSGEFSPVRHQASIGQRLVNHLVDSALHGVVVSILLLIMVVVANFFASGGHAIRDPLGITLFIIVWILIVLSFPAYYIFFETIWQRTPGKWASDTKVVRLDGSKPKFWRIVGRTFARFIPFEPFSYLFGSYPYGWHDAISKTMVVPAQYTPEESAQIHPHDKGKTHTVAVVIGTVIVIFVMMAILGIFSSVVLVSLDAARAKGYDAGVRAGLSHIQLEYVASHPEVKGGAINFCNDPDMIGTLNTFIRTQYQCFNNENHWALSVQLKSQRGHLCVDDTSADGILRSKAVTTFSCVENQ